MPPTQHLTLSVPQSLLPLSPQCHSNKNQLSKMPHLNAVVSLTTLCLLLSPLSLGTRSFPPEPHTNPITLPRFAEAPHYRNGIDCPNLNPSFIHIAMTLDSDYLRGTIAAIHSILRHATCPQNITFHLITSESDSLPQRVLTQLVRSTFPSLTFKVHLFRRERAVASLISASVRRALESPLNYARNYLGEILDGVDRVIYLDSDLVLVDDIRKLWHVTISQSRVIAAPEYCHANFTKYFTNRFWSNPVYSRAFGSRRVCYFNTGVMVMDLKKWREEGYTERLEKWMRVQKSTRIYELGSLPPFLLVFAGEVERVHHRWNQHGLGGDNVNGLCRDLHHGPVSLLHWSGKGKPWVRLDQNKPCPLDRLWEPYDLFNPPRELNNPWTFSSSLLVGYPHDLL